MKIVFLLAFAFLPVCTSREIVKKNAVIVEFEDSDESGVAFVDAQSYDDDEDDNFEYDLEALKYPRDCVRTKLIDAANIGGCKAREGVDRITSVYKEKFVTSIPQSVKDNNTCRSIIKALNAACSDELRYPGDCISATLKNVANKGGCKVKEGPHTAVFKETIVTRIPVNVKKDPDCEVIIRALNAEC